MPRSLRAIALATAILLAALWLAPALALPRLVARVVEAEGVEIDVEGVRPTLPWGVTAGRVVVVRGVGRVEAREVSARILPSGLRVEAGIGGGTLLLRMRGLTLRGG